MPSSKKKNGKDGGVVAAVTKHAAGKFSSATQGRSDDVSDISSSAAPSPDWLPTIDPPSAPIAPSPLLDAISTASPGTSISPNTHQWAKAGIPLGSSPGNLISLMGESPPTQPSSYEDRASIQGWASPPNRPSPRVVPGSPSPPIPYRGPILSVSPPSLAPRRPLSFQVDLRHPSSEAYAPSAASIRRSSMHSHAAFSRTAQHPPLPHQTQAHFYGTTDIDLNLGHRNGLVPGSRGLALAFDSLPGGTSSKKSVVVAGYEGGLEVYSASRKNGLDQIASLTGLRGGVTQAKILTWSSPQNQAGSLVAVIIHGPRLPAAESDPYRGPETAEATTRADVEPIQQVPGANKSTPIIDHYQTSVEIYSLVDGRLVTVLLEMPPLPLSIPITSPIFRAPPPTGDLRLLASGGNLIVASGKTGECWIFCQHADSSNTSTDFKCAGKIWTQLQQPLPEVGIDKERLDVARPRNAPTAAIVAINGRWIAYCPAKPTSQASLEPSILVAAHGKAPGLMSMTAPLLPTNISTTETHEGDSIVGKVVREATQELIHGAKWVGELGLQAFNNYWNKPNAAALQARSPTLEPQNWHSSQSQFPPTHSAMKPMAPKEPGLVSIVDVSTMTGQSSVQPFITFETSGCSFLSFSPSGLSLFTVSSKGDVQSLWDLMRVKYSKSSPIQPSTTAPTVMGSRVRRIAQFSRMTVARIVDIAWTRPNGETIAMVTERGTVHFLDLPKSSYIWPPPRRRTNVPAGTAADGPRSTITVASNALSSAIDAARPLLPRPRRSSTNLPQTAKARVVEHASQGGKLLAAGISQSLGYTGSAITQLRHRADNRISLPTSNITPSTGCVMFVTGRKHHSLFILGNGVVRTYPPRIRRVSTEGKTLGLRYGQYQEHKLSMLPDDLVARSVKRLIEPEEYLDLMDLPADTINHAVLPRPQAKRVVSNQGSSIPHAEVESSAPYQPFHTDKRIALYAYGFTESLSRAPLRSPPVSDLTSTSPLDNGRTTSKKKARHADASPQPAPLSILANRASGAWAFGQPFITTRLDTKHRQLSKEESLNMSTDEMRALPQSAMERSVLRRDDGEQLVITTRRRRKGARGNGVDEGEEADEDGFFEDDCEVLDFADQRV